MSSSITLEFLYEYVVSIPSEYNPNIFLFFGIGVKMLGLIYICICINALKHGSSVTDLFATGVVGISFMYYSFRIR